MKTLIRALYFLLFLFLMNNGFTQQPEPNEPDTRCVFIQPSIIVPAQMCAGECFNVYISHPFGNGAEFTIIDPNGDESNYPGYSFLFCPTILGEYTFSADIVNYFNPYPKTVIITENYIPTITSSAIQNCPGNNEAIGSGNNCQKVCEGATVTYTANNSQGQDIEWDILGADSYEINGNQATIIWGAAGYGHVAATIVPPPKPLLANCQGTVSPTSNNIDDGSCAVQIAGGIGPYEVIFTISNGMVFNRTGVEGVNIYTEVPPGIFSVEVISADGQTSTCGFTLLSQDDPTNACPNQPFATIETGETDNNCCTILQSNITGGASPFNFLWSNGSNTTTTPYCGTGIYSLTVTDVNGCTSTNNATLTTCLPPCIGFNQICIEILAVPEAQFSTALVSQNNTISVCTGQNIQFNNESEHASAYAWFLGDGTNITGTDVTYSYDEAGTYEIQMIATNECFCADTTSLLVEVSATMVPEILCQGTLCEGSIGTYHTSVDCDSYQWSVSPNGLILNGGAVQDSFIIVEWISGVEGTITLATEGCNTSICETPNTIIIPLLQSEGVISGPEVLCPLEQGNFRIPNFGGTSIEWIISSGGEILSDDINNEAVAYWEAPADGQPVWIAAKYTNCYLECDGRDTFWLDILPPFHLEGIPQFCLGDELTFQALRGDTAVGIPVNWSIIDAAANEIWSSNTNSTTISENLNLAIGNYIVRGALDDMQNLCNGQASLPFSIIPPPSIPEGIIGDSLICPGNPSLYQISGDPGAYRFVWEITNGNDQSIKEGENVIVTWGDVPPYELRLHRIPLSGPPCWSTPYTLSVSTHGELEINGPLAACVDEISSYDLSNTTDPAVQWRIEPPEAGSIMTGSTSSGINVYWHEAGMAMVVVESCGLTKSWGVMINENLPPTVNFPVALCENNTAEVTLGAFYLTHAWYDDQNVLISTTAAPQLSAGNYQVEVEQSNGCSSSTSFSIREWPSPTASISTGAYPALCPGGQTVNIVALNEDATYTYRWFRNDQLLNALNPIYAASQTGSYTVEVSDLNGCVNLSAPIQLQDCESIGGICENGFCTPSELNPPDNPPLNSCTVNGVITFDYNYLSCDSIQLINQYADFLPGSIEWYFLDTDGTSLATANGPSVTMGYDIPGIYVAIMSGLVNSNQGGSPCRVGVYQNIAIPAKALFDVSINCPGSPTSFIDRSIFLPDETILSWHWDFGDPGSNDNQATSPSPSHIYNNSGNYTVSLTIEMASGCIETYQKEITIPKFPTVDIVLPIQNCEGLALPFSIADPEPLLTYQWEFIGPSGNTISQAQGDAIWYNFDEAATYEVVLHVTDRLGCTEEFTQTFDITPNELEGPISIDPDNTVCTGDSIILQAPVGGTSWNWSNGSSTESIMLFTDEIVFLNMKNENGCNYSPPVVATQFLSLPYADIQSVELNEQGQTIQIYEDYRAICDGDRIFLQTIENENYTYLWSNGESGFSTEYSSDRDTLLPEGTHYFTVSVTDNNTGCSTISTLFQVDVYPKPGQPSLSGSIPRCEGELNQIYIKDAADSLQYHWSTGAIGDTIYTFLGGLYNAFAQNEYGCTSYPSWNRFIRGLPYDYQMPTGCFEVCFPDTLCIPDFGYNWRVLWYHNGIPLSDLYYHNAEELIIEEPGEYWVEIVYKLNDENWECFFTTESIFIEAADGYGEMMGSVIYDLNNNGLIDPTDSLATGISVQLMDSDGQLLESTLTDSQGNYVIDSLSSSNSYYSQIDTNGFWPHWQIDSLWRQDTLKNCGNILGNNWLLRPICNSEPISVEEIRLCPLEYASYHQDYTIVGDSVDIVYDMGEACDSIARWHLVELPSELIVESYELCINDSIIHDGIVILPGGGHLFNYQNSEGCDSTLIIQTSILPSPEEELEMYTCPETPVSYNGVELYAGDEQYFTFSSQAGCDSIVFVRVQPLPSQQDSLQLSGCEGDSILYANQFIPVGSSQLFSFQNSEGCDSTVWVHVHTLPNQQDTLELSGCEGSTLSYAGQIILVGDSHLFNFQNEQGCDSILMVTTNPLPTSHDTLQENICRGTQFNFNGTLLEAGDDMIFSFTNQYGCDSLITVMVNSFPVQEEIVWLSESSCADLATGQIEMAGTPPDDYLFSLDQNNWQAAGIFANLPSGTISIWVQDNHGCSESIPVQVGILPPLQVQVTDTALHCDGTPLTIKATTNYPPTDLSWQWQDGNTSASTNVLQTGNYSVTVSNQCETVSHNFPVVWADEALGSPFYLPNAFSPNDDGINDIWRPLPKSGLQILDYELHIFDRWGGLVFHSIDANKGWNGKLKSDLENNSVFVITLKAEVQFCGEVIKIEEARDISLLR